MSSQLVSAVSGAAGGFVSSTLLFPLDLVKTRIQSGEQGGGLAVARPSRISRLALCRAHSYRRGSIPGHAIAAARAR